MKTARIVGLAARSAPSLLLTVLSVLPHVAAAESVREMESRSGRVRITVVPIDPAPEAQGAESDAGAIPVAPAAPAAPIGMAAIADADDVAASSATGLPIDSVADFTSLSGIDRSGEALLQIDYYDKDDRRELRFPLKYSELRRFRLRHPLDYQSGTAEERMVRLIADLARSLRIEMRDPANAGGKP